MVFSKYLKESYAVAGYSIRLALHHETALKLNSCAKICWGAHNYLNHNQYSTVSSKYHNLQKSALKYGTSLNFSASLSTDGTAEKYKVVITNPAEGTSTTLDSTLNISDELKNPSEVFASSPEITDIASSLTETLPSAADILEPSLASLGLCHWTPVGLVQMLLEYMHISMHWPWWVTIIATTAIARVLLFPVLLKTQKNAIHMSNCMPQLQYLQMKFGEARRTGNSMEAAKLANEMMLFMKEKNISPFKNAIFPLIQAPVFLSFFFALRAMAKVPVESMKEGGILWVTDLTVPDPYYILPIVACSTLYVVLKVGAESGVKMENLKMAKYAIQALPFIALPFCINFPSAVLYYWCSNNFITLATVSILKIKPVRRYFNLPNPQPIDPKFAPPKKGFIKSIKDAYEDQKVLAVIDERRRIDEVRFQKAGTGPIPRTYSYDPTKPRPSKAASIANKTVAAKEHKS